MSFGYYFFDLSALEKCQLYAAIHETLQYLRFTIGSVNKAKIWDDDVQTSKGKVSKHM